MEREREKEREREREGERERARRRERDAETERRNIMQHDNTKNLDTAQHHAVAWCVPI